MSYNFSPFKLKLQKTLDHISDDLNTLRTGKASPQLLDPVMVEVYGSRLKVVEVASVSAPDPTLIMVTPWDKNVIENIEKAIASTPLNLNPVVDGDIIRISVPPLTEERRKEMVKTLHQKIEAGKVMMRNVRADTKREIEKMKGQDGISEDDIKIDLEELDEIFKAKLDSLDEVGQKKETDLMTV